ncbi:MAG: M23 family metallopeptidase [Patescibacteria group bacterium]
MNGVAGLFLAFSLFPLFTLGAEDTLVSLTPADIVQGEPLMVQIHQASVSRIASADFNGTKLSVFLYKGKPTALIATALELKEGEYPLRITLKDGSVIEKTVTVGLRPRVQKPLGIPEKLGGNTPASAKKLVSTLQKDNASLTNLKTQDHVLWTEDFALPLKSAVVTDTFGYQRDTIGYEIAHKGTDFRATTGSPVLAMNRGVVRVAKTFSTYGKTVVIDHGLGLFTFYMHLSKLKVWQGQLVQKGQLLALSGDTGYATGPHLHITVRIGNTSVDPEKFLAFFD